MHTAVLQHCSCGVVYAPEAHPLFRVPPKLKPVRVFHDRKRMRQPVERKCLKIKYGITHGADANFEQMETRTVGLPATTALLTSVTARTSTLRHYWQRRATIPSLVLRRIVALVAATRNQCSHDAVPLTADRTTNRTIQPWFARTILSRRRRRSQRGPRPSALRCHAHWLTS
jgi:hypothetical protein